MSANYFTVYLGRERFSKRNKNITLLTGSKLKMRIFPDENSC